MVIVVILHAKTTMTYGLNFLGDPNVAKTVSSIQEHSLIEEAAQERGTLTAENFLLRGALFHWKRTSPPSFAFRGVEFPEFSLSQAGTALGNHGSAVRLRKYGREQN